MNLTKSIVLLILSLLTLFQSGCASIVAAQLKGKMPQLQAHNMTISLNIPVVGGGSLEVVNQTVKDGTIHVDEYHEQINTGYGSLKIDGQDVTLTPATK